MEKILNKCKDTANNIILSVIIIMVTSPLMTYADIGGTAEKWRNTAATVGAAIVGIALIISLVKDAFQYAKGGGSVGLGKVIGKIVFLIAMIGIIALVQGGAINGLGNTLAEKGSTVVEDVATSL